MAKLIKSLLIQKFKESNYSYFIQQGPHLAIVDPACSTTVIDYLTTNNLIPTQIWTTHHHADHSSGNIDLLEKYPNLEIYGFDERVPGVNNKLKHGDTFKLGQSTVKALHTPGHTTGCICFNVDGMVFTGDVLFVGGYLNQLI
jgi:hydroxyacylglutathione hydrolase